MLGELALEGETPTYFQKGLTLLILKAHDREFGILEERLPGLRLQRTPLLEQEQGSEDTEGIPSSPSVHGSAGTSSCKIQKSKGKEVDVMQKFCLLGTQHKAEEA